MTEIRSPYPSYDVLSKRGSPSWNDQTRRVIERRLNDVPGRRFFEPDEWELLEVVCERLLPQGFDQADPWEAKVSHE